MTVLVVPLHAQEVTQQTEHITENRNVAHRMSTAGVRELLRALMRFEGPLHGASQTLERIDLAPNEQLHCMVRGGAYIFSADKTLSAELHTEPAGAAIGSRRELLQHAAREDIGSGSVFDLSDSGTDLVRRNLSWSTLFVGGTWWTWIVERVEPVETVPGEPLSGKWTGAYSYTASRIDDGNEVTPLKDAGTLSAILLQNGPRCLFRALASDWTFAGEGILVGNDITVGQSYAEAARVFHATYSPEDGKFRGELRVATPDEAGVMTVFLQRAGPG